MRSSHLTALGRGRLTAGCAGALVVALASTPHHTAAQALATRAELLRSIYPGAQIKSERVFLTDAQRRAAAAAAGHDVVSGLIARYLATKDGRPVGRAYIDTHVVRTKRESLLVALDASGRVRRVEVTAFLEPPEYEPPAVWLGQFEAHGLEPDLQVQRAIRPLAGATLTARAATEAVRRVLAIDAVLPEGAPK